MEVALFRRQIFQPANWCNLIKVIKSFNLILFFDTGVRIFHFNVLRVFCLHLLAYNSLQLVFYCLVYSFFGFI